MSRTGWLAARITLSLLWVAAWPGAYWLAAHHAHHAAVALAAHRVLRHAHHHAVSRAARLAAARRAAAAGHARIFAPVRRLSRVLRFLRQPARAVRAVTRPLRWAGF